MNNSNSTATHEVSRDRIFSVFVTQGLIGLLALLAATWFFAEQTREVAAALGSSMYLLLGIVVVCAIALQLLKFELTNLVYVSLGITAFIVMYPLLGTVISAWTAVAVTTFTRWLAMKQIGPVKIDVQDRPLEYAKTFGLFGTYGLPVVLASWCYSLIGGQTPLSGVSAAAALRMTLCGALIILLNNLIMLRVLRSYGYSLRKMLKLAAVDSSIYLLTLPFAIVLSFSYSTLGPGALIALIFTGIIGNAVARNLAMTRSRSRLQLQRLASLTNVGRLISLDLTRDELLMTIYQECRKVVDVSLFSIALYDEYRRILSFELDIAEGEPKPKESIEVGEGLNSWVVTNNQPLLLGSIKEERRLGLSSVSDGIISESWLGVPMVSRDRVIGVISVQSFRKNAFSPDDVLLLTSIANQAAVAIENGILFKDLESLTFALETRVGERTIELRETNLRLMAADRSKNQFLANMSHELRTPLNSIIGFSGLLLENTQNILTPRFYKFLENIQTAGNHLLALINDILDLSKIEAGKMELRPEKFDLRDTVQSVERVMHGMAADARIKLESDVHPDTPLVRLDEGRLKQILFNLVSNAFKFSPDGGAVGIRVSPVGAADSPLRLDSVCIRVCDEGIGMSAEELERIFDEFYQAEEGRRVSRSGTGLGLSLTRNFVELHRGLIEVKSESGKGSEFTLYLPVEFDPTPDAELPPQSAAGIPPAH